ncbi:MAG: hypothetical protein JST80_10600 [Bdellovibrionales bacterium]|nr:hypothetical protein [Bdellovibrionales bacterium]
MSHTSFAQTPTPTPLLRANQGSGFTPPQYRFSSTCTLTVEGKLRSDVYSGTDSQRGWGTHDVVDRDLTAQELSDVNTQIAAASVGPFETRQNPCDIGGFSVIANVRSADIVLVDSHDCGTRITNNNETAKKLVEWVRKECKFK